MATAQRPNTLACMSDNGSECSRFDRLRVHTLLSGGCGYAVSLLVSPTASSWDLGTCCLHIFRDMIIDSSLQMVAARHPLVTTVAHDCVQLPEVAV